MEGFERGIRMARYRVCSIVAIAICAEILSLQAGAQPGAPAGEWRSYAADTFGSKYSAVEQITAENFSALEIAWKWQTADTHLVYEGEHGTSLVPAQALFDLMEAEEPGRCWSWQSSEPPAGRRPTGPAGGRRPVRKLLQRCRR